MRKQKRKSNPKLIIICRWAMVSLLIQTCILFYLSNYYFADKAMVAFKDIIQEKRYARNDIKLPQDAKNISMSSSNRYAMYYLGNALHVINLVDGKGNEVDLEGSLKDIKIFSEEHIYEVNNIKGIVTNLKSKKETKFTGKFIDMNDNGILSLNDGTVSITNLK